MWFDSLNEISDLARGAFPISYILMVPLIILISPISPASAAHDFSVYRMQQFDLQGTSYGSLSSLVNLEARTLDSKVYTRRCIIAKLSELSIDKIHDLSSQNAGALLVLVPEDLDNYGNSEQKEAFAFLESRLLQESLSFPVYFSKYTSELKAIYEEVNLSINTDIATSAAEALFSSASSNGYQLVVTGSAPKPITDFKLINIQGKLHGAGVQERLQTIAIVAHYDSSGLVPMLSKGSDSNGSGVVALLALARIFSRLYSDEKTKPKFNLVFLLSSGGKANFIGTKKWIEDQVESSELNEIRHLNFAICLDSLGSGNSLYSHVSKPPKEDTATHAILSSLNASSVIYNGKPVDMVHKKINLQSVRNWEHERFSIGRLPAFTISHYEKSSQDKRQSILDIPSSVNIKSLKRNIKIIGEGLARYMYNISDENQHSVFEGSLDIEEDMIQSWQEMISSVARPVQLLTYEKSSSSDSTNQKRSRSIVSVLRNILSNSLSEVKLHTTKQDKRDTEYVFYSGLEYTMNAYSVKPAVFDLFLTLCIAMYLGVFYLITQYLGAFASLIRSFSSKKVKAQ